MDGLGGAAFIAFKENATGAVGGLFERMFHYYQFRQQEFLDHYHKRSNVESTFSMIKRKFGDNLRSKSDIAMFERLFPGLAGRLGRWHLLEALTKPTVEPRKRLSFEVLSGPLTESRSHRPPQHQGK